MGRRPRGTIWRDIGHEELVSQGQPGYNVELLEGTDLGTTYDVTICQYNI